MKVCNGPSKASNLDKLMSNDASVCHAHFHNHSIAITLNKFTEQLNVTLNQFEYQSQCLQLVTFTSLLFHYLSTRHCDTLQQKCIHVNATSRDVNQISNDHNALRLPSDQPHNNVIDRCQLSQPQHIPCSGSTA